MRRFLKVSVALTVVVTGLSLAGVKPLSQAHAQMIQSREGIALQNQILELRQQLQSMQQGGGSNSALAPPAQSQGQSGNSANALLPGLLQQVQTLNDEVQSLRGRVDTLEHEVASQHDQINQEIGNLKFQMTQGTNGAASAGGSPQSGDQGNQSDNGGGAANNPPPPDHRSGTVPQARSSSGHVEASITAAQRALAGHDYATAESDSRAVIAHQGKRAYGGGAEFILAESLERQGNHQAAAIAYDDAYSADKAGPHAADSLLGLANSLSAIHQNNAACDTLGSLASQFPHRSASLSTRLHVARQRAHCR